MSSSYLLSKPVFVLERGHAPYFVTDMRLTPVQNFLSESLSMVVIKNLFYPIEVAQTLMQTSAEDARDGLIPTLAHVHAQYGLGGLYRGNVASNLSGTLYAIGLFAAKAAFRGLTFENKAITTIVGMLPAQIVLAILYPFQVAKARMISHPSKYKDVVQTLATVNEEEGLSGLYHGFGFSLVESIPFFATTAAGYFLAENILRKARHEMSITENLVYAMLGSFIATILHYPFDTAKKIVQSKKAIGDDSVVETLVDTGNKHGLVGLYKGFTAHLAKAPALFVQRAVYAGFQEYLLKANGLTGPYRHPIVPVVTPVQY